MKISFDVSLTLSINVRKQCFWLEAVLEDDLWHFQVGRQPQIFCKAVFGPPWIALQMLVSKFNSFTAISLLFRGSGLPFILGHLPKDTFNFKVIFIPISKTTKARIIKLCIQDNLIQTKRLNGTNEYKRHDLGHQFFVDPGHSVWPDAQFCHFLFIFGHHN